MIVSSGVYAFSSHWIPDVMSRRFWTVIAFFLSSTFWICLSENRSTTGCSRLSRLPFLSCMAVKVPMTLLVTDLRSWLMPAMYGA